MDPVSAPEFARTDNVHASWKGRLLAMGIVGLP